MKKYLSLILGLVLLSIALPVSAHQPRLVESTGVVKIENPEISQAFYGELNGESAIYRIISDTPFNFYIGLLVPDVTGVRRDFSALVRANEKTEPLVVLDGPNYTWTKFHEEFAGDDYWQGPEFSVKQEDGGLGGVEVEKGTYDIIVSNPDNQGKYVLAVGYKEEFGEEAIKEATKILPIIKTKFFNKSALSIFDGKIGKYALVGFLTIVVFLALVIFIIVRIVKKIKKKK